MAGSAVVAGLGSTGQSVIRHLAARGWRVAGTDTRAQPPGIDALRAAFPQLRVACGGLDAALLEGADLVVASPGLSQQEGFFAAARTLGIEVIGDIELFAREGLRQVAGITGTHGKSTVTALLAHMARRAGRSALAGGNLGPPALDLLRDGGAQLYVLELSSDQLETTHSLHLAAATVLNVTADHLDRYADVDAYAAAKARIFDRCDTAVLNCDDARGAAMARAGQRTLGFSLDYRVGADYYLEIVDGRDWLCRTGERLLAMDELHLVGRHNAANALAALAMGEALGLAQEPMLQALRDFAGLPHRAAFVRELAGVRYVNDSKGTNVGATLAAALAGKVRQVLTIGRDAERIEQALQGVCPLQRCATLEEAVVAAARVAQPGDTVLLSPACASLDMCRDYAHRGEVFAAAVMGLAA